MEISCSGCVIPTVQGTPSLARRLDAALQSELPIWATSETGGLKKCCTEADVIAQAANGIVGPADFADVVALIRAGQWSANVHTAIIAAGGIRSQIDNGGGDHGHKDH